jgi:hypothetical protein
MQNTNQKSPGGPILFVGLVLVALGLVGESRQQGGDVTVTPPYPSYATATANARMIAATGIDVTGSSILYLVDTEARQLAVYQAQGGTKSTMSVKFIGARNIDLDLQVNGYNDKSEYTYQELAEEFAKGSAGDSDE